jgi:organic hydroperoxide reductase OsmC/OhrA
MSTLRAQEDYVVTNRARAQTLDGKACAIHVRDFAPLISDEPPSRGGANLGMSPLELLLASLCACTNVTTSRMAEKLRSRTCRSTTGPCGCTW